MKYNKVKKAELTKLYNNLKYSIQQDYYKKINDLLVQNAIQSMSESERLARDYAASFQNAFLDIDKVFKDNISHNLDIDKELDGL